MKAPPKNKIKKKVTFYLIYDLIAGIMNLTIKKGTDTDGKG